jgi:fructokinase
MRVISLGEVLWDVFPDKEFLGGAPLNFSANMQRLGNSVLLLTAVGDDTRGGRAVAQMSAMGLSTEFIQIVTERPTGAAVVVTDHTGSASYVIERPAAFDCVRIEPPILARLQQFDPQWIYFGTLTQTDSRSFNALAEIVRHCSDAKRLYDMNLRTGHWNFALVEDLSRIATVLKLNDAEAELLFHRVFNEKAFSLEEFCRYWSSTYGVQTICITLGGAGCAVFIDDTLRTFSGYTVKVVDTVGAGDAFAAAFLHGLHLGWPVERIAPFANSLGALVASRAGATPTWTLDECLEFTGSALSARDTR